jgi:hypothetical protein
MYELQKIARVSNTESQRIASESNQKVTGSVLENLVSSLPSAIDELRSKQKLTYKMLDNLHAVLPFWPGCPGSVRALCLPGRLVNP